MLSYNRVFPRNPEPIPQVYHKTVINEDETSSILSQSLPFESPFKGLDSNSFTLSARIKAGVNLQNVPPTKLGSSIGSVDSATSFVDSAPTATE